MKGLKTGKHRVPRGFKKFLSKIFFECDLCKY